MAYTDQTSIDIDLNDIEGDALTGFVQRNFTPAEVFEQDELETWAKENGWIQEGGE